MTTTHKLPFPVYRVGGCVRDSLLGVPVNDVDYVVVGATEAAMLAEQYKKVGAFPVFLHPVTNEEYALARTERKSGVGYSGFTVFADESVTLEEDLSRRDFTINAMAMDDSGAIIDPYNGQDDLQLGILRHVGPAFAEDPLRVLRGARFGARYGFSIAPETIDLMQHLVTAGEMENLTRERIYIEFSKGFSDRKPSKMLQVLNDVGALSRLFPEANTTILADSSWYQKLDLLAKTDHTLCWPYLLYKLAPEQMRTTGEKWRCLKDDIGIATTMTIFTTDVLHPQNLTAEALLDLWSRSDARRQPQKFEQALVVYATEEGLAGDAITDLLSRWAEVTTVLKNVVESEALKDKRPGEDAKTCITRARVAALNAAFTNQTSPSLA